MSESMEQLPGVRIPGDRQGGTMVPGSPGSELYAESSAGPPPVGELPAGPQAGYATADDDNNHDSEEENRLTRSIVDRYLGDSVQGTGPLLSTVRLAKSPCRYLQLVRV